MILKLIIKHKNKIIAPAYAGALIFLEYHLWGDDAALKRNNSFKIQHIPNALLIAVPLDLGLYLWRAVLIKQGDFGV